MDQTLPNPENTGGRDREPGSPPDSLDAGDAARLIWKEWRHRHDLYWRSLYR